MLLTHFESLKPFCPACALAGHGHHLLTLSTAETSADVIDGELNCPRDGCDKRYPIIDGIPVIMQDPDGYLREHLGIIWNQEPPPEAVQARLATAVAGTEADIHRQHLSTYTHNHFGNQDPDEKSPPGDLAVTDIVRRCLEGVAIPAGPVLDIGCAVGGTTLTLGQLSNATVLGIDVNFGMLRAARRNARSGNVSYGRRRLGTLYDQRSFGIENGSAGNTDYWACDVLALPFAAERFALVNSFNVLDCVSYPADLLAIIVAALAPGGKALITSPYDWLASVTPAENWLGGTDGDPEPIVRAVALEHTRKQGLPEVALENEWDDIPWQTRLSERGRVAYSMHGILLGRTN